MHKKRGYSNQIWLKYFKKLKIEPLIQKTYRFLVMCKTYEMAIFYFDSKQQL